MYDEIYETFQEVAKDNIKRDLFNNSTESAEEVIEDIKNNKIAIYTAFTGDYDTLKEPEFIDVNCDYICFTDNPNLTSDTWKIILMEDSILDNNRKAKQYKILPHKYLSDYKYSFWLDGTFKIKGSLREYIYKNIKANSPMLCVVHTERDCIYEEYEASHVMPRYPRVVMKEQVDTYKAEGFPEHYGMGVMGSIFRKHDDENVIKVMDDWWQENIKFTNQDQLSFAYVCWKNNFHPSVSLIYYWDNEYWAKEETNNEYHHKVVLDTPMVSKNLLNNLKPKVDNLNSDGTLELSKEELYLLLNDVKGLSGYRLDVASRSGFLNKTYKEILASNSMKLTKPIRELANLARIMKYFTKNRNLFSYHRKIKNLDVINYDAYLASHPDCKVDPIYHYITFTSKSDPLDEKIKYISPIFDLYYYVNSNNLNETEDPLIHYISKGFKNNTSINREGLFITNFNQHADIQYEKFIKKTIEDELKENHYISNPDILVPYIMSKEPFETDTIKVGVFLEDNFENMNACPFIRIHALFNKLSESGNYHFFIYGKDTMPLIGEKDILKSKLFDVMVFQRSNFYSNKLLKQAKKHGIKVVYETDDNLTELSPENVSYEYYKLHENNILKLVKESDVITVSTTGLANRMKDLGCKNVTIIRNYYLNDILPLKQFSENNSSEKIKIGYFGTMTHDADVRLLYEIITRVKEAGYPIELEVAGGIRAEADWYTTIKLPNYPMSMNTFVKWLSDKIDWDIGVIPLVDSDFNNDKSELKFIEFTALGVPIIASPTQSYLEAIEDHVTGFIAHNVDEWVDKLQILVSDPNFRHAMHNNAKEKLLKDYNINSRVLQWDEIFKKLVE